MSYMPNLEWSNHKLFLFNKSKPFEEDRSHLICSSAFGDCGHDFFCKIGDNYLLKFQHFFLGVAWSLDEPGVDSEHMGGCHRVQISLYNYRFYLPDFFHNHGQESLMPVFFLDHGQKWLVAGFLRWPWSRMSHWYGTTNNHMFLDPLWPPNPTLGFGFSSRVHLGVVYWNFSLAQTHLSTMLIEDNYAKRTW